MEGTASTPRLLMIMEPFLGSYSNYNLGIYIEVDDDYPLRDLYLKTFYVNEKDFDKLTADAEDSNDLKEILAEKNNELVTNGQFVIPGRKQTLLKEITLPFSSKKEKADYIIDLQWNKGSYFIHGELTIDDFIPSFDVKGLLVNDKPPVVKEKPHFVFRNLIGPITQKNLQINQEMDLQLRKQNEDRKHQQGPK